MNEKFYHSKETVQQYIELAEGFDGKEIVQKLKKFLPEKSCVLELGSGPGKDLAILSEFYTVTGSDNSKQFLDYIHKNNPQSDLVLLDAINLNIDRQFQALYSNKVLHHLTDVELIESIKNQQKILLPEGIVCHTFWKGDKAEEMHGMLFNYHMESFLEEAFSGKFEILLLEVYKEMDEGDSILMIGRKV